MWAAHVHEHPPDVGVVDDRARLALRRVRGPALHPLLGVADRRLVGPLGEAEALQPDRQAGRVHHREHVPHAGVGLADEVADGAVVLHRAGGAGVDAHLVLDADAAHGVALAGVEHLRHDEAADATGAGRRVGDAGEHEVDDVLGQVLLAVGDEDLLAR